MATIFRKYNLVFEKTFLFSSCHRMDVERRPRIKCPTCQGIYSDIVAYFKHSITGTKLVQKI